MAMHGPASRVGRSAGGGKDKLPAPFGRGVGIFAIQRVGQVDRPEPLGGILLVEHFDVSEMASKRVLKPWGQHRAAVLAALPVPYHELVSIEPHVLHAKAEGLRKPEPAPIEQACDPSVRARHRTQETSYVGPREHGGEAPRTFGTLDRPDVVEVEAKDLLVQEDEGIEGLVLRRGRNAAFRGKGVEKSTDIVGVEVAWMGGVVEAHVAMGPRRICLLGAVTVSATATRLTNAVKEFRGWSRHRAKR